MPCVIGGQKSAFGGHRDRDRNRVRCASVRHGPDEGSVFRCSLQREPAGLGKGAVGIHGDPDGAGGIHEGGLSVISFGREGDNGRGVVFSVDIDVYDISECVA